MVIFHINHHFPMVFPWFSHGFPTVFPWNILRLPRFRLRPPRRSGDLRRPRGAGLGATLGARKLRALRSVRKSGHRWWDGGETWEYSAMIIIVITIFVIIITIIIIIYCYYYFFSCWSKLNWVDGVVSWWHKSDEFQDTDVPCNMQLGYGCQALA